jgi:polar amino acid transport system substrate-binding protein
MRAHLKTLLFLLLITFSSAQLAAAEPLSIRADLWPPYNDEPKSIKPGYMIQVMWEIFKPLGYAIDYQPLSWTDSLEAVRKGQFNAVVGATKDDAPDLIFPQEVFGMSDTAFFVKKGTAWKFTGVESLPQIRLGVIESYSYNEELDVYINANKGTKRIVEAKGADPLADLVSMLQSGKIDAIAEDTNVMLNTMISSKVLLGSIIPAGKCAEISALYVAFSPKNPKSRELATRFDSGLKELRTSGKLQAILKLYGLQDWKKL